MILLGHIIKHYYKHDDDDDDDYSPYNKRHESDVHGFNGTSFGQQCSSVQLQDCIFHGKVSQHSGAKRYSEVLLQGSVRLVDVVRVVVRGLGAY